MWKNCGCRKVVHVSEMWEVVPFRTLWCVFPRWCKKSSSLLVMCCTLLPCQEILWYRKLNYTSSTYTYRFNKQIRSYLNACVQITFFRYSLQIKKKTYMEATSLVSVSELFVEFLLNLLWEFFTKSCLASTSFMKTSSTKGINEMLLICHKFFIQFG